MLHNVPTTLNRLLRQTVLHHPNAWGGAVLRKVVTRPAPATIGGLPVLGGLAVLDSEDEADYTYEHVGNVALLAAELFGAAGIMHDRRDTQVSDVTEYRFLIEPQDETEDGTPTFTPKNRDLVYVALGADFATAAKACYEIVGVETTSNIPPYTQRYVCNRRAELDS